MGDAKGARKIMDTGQTSDANTVKLGDAGLAYAQSIVFRKGPYLVRIVAYESTPGAAQALLALAHEWKRNSNPFGRASCPSTLSFDPREGRNRKRELP